jgi:hypothetical protein
LNENFLFFICFCIKVYYNLYIGDTKMNIWIQQVNDQLLATIRDRMLEDPINATENIHLLKALAHYMLSQWLNEKGEENGS